ncbi:hypothetical protein ASPZODRAFT_132369 [Penicilliopsis zonata CBS 506.65]|uniref:Phosphatidylinositol-specific phospholipase C X domain-containing protein n=1 Tax=Penicilliopsis zonata CBS 506.65 TaxID=1073090 RepID=A0A1L9SJH1_9EURO|nr:hypothetical protein ASPZODRAFT_132369 [Penicilliopsis zonata CBS 506.65]OJJ47382.1 hypothetical protein ASPZODRAFT_132369 [Penicilliopsis zonata CBS 506.65]
MLDDNYHVQGNEGIVGSSGPHGALLMWKSKSGPDYDSVRWKGQIMGYGIRQGGWQVLSATSLLREDLKLPGLAHSDKDDAMVGVWWDKDDALQYSIGVMPAPYYAVRPEMRSWMALIDGSQLISRVSIPGTHDSATRFVGVTESKFIKWLGSDAAKTAQTQDWTIEMQLAKGIRYFDLRVTGNLVCCHGPATCYTDDSKKTSLTLEMVLEEFYTFLERFPTEGLLVQIADDNDRHEGRSEEDIGDDIKKLTAKKPERWRLDHTTPRVDELRGRIQLLCRFKHRGPTPGIQVSWGGGDKGELQSHRQSNETGGIVVQDYYNVYYWYLDEKRAWITNLIETCQQATESDDQIFINFLSCAVHTQPRDSLGGIEFESDPITNPRTGAYGEVSSVWNPVSDFFGAPKPDYDDKGINPWFLTELEEYEDPKNHPVPQLGVTVLDFAGETPTMVSRIIKTNWPYRRFWRNWDTF